MLVIENGTLYTPTRVIPDGAVLVDGQRIEAVGKRDELVVPRRHNISTPPAVPSYRAL